MSTIEISNCHECLFFKKGSDFSECKLNGMILIVNKKDKTVPKYCELNYGLVTVKLK